MYKIGFWDILAAGVIIFSGVNMFWGDKIPLFDFVSDPTVKAAMTIVSVFLVSMIANGMRKR